jgi:hypothetical protein
VVWFSDPAPGSTGFTADRDASGESDGPCIMRYTGTVIDNQSQERECRFS